MAYFQEMRMIHLRSIEQKQVAETAQEEVQQHGMDVDQDGQREDLPQQIICRPVLGVHIRRQQPAIVNAQDKIHFSAAAALLSNKQTTCAHSSFTRVTLDDQPSSTPPLCFVLSPEHNDYQKKTEKTSSTAKSEFIRRRHYRRRRRPTRKQNRKTKRRVIEQPACRVT